MKMVGVCKVFFLTTFRHEGLVCVTFRFQANRTNAEYFVLGFFPQVKIAHLHLFGVKGQYFLKLSMDCTEVWVFVTRVYSLPRGHYGHFGVLVFVGGAICTVSFNR